LPAEAPPIQTIASAASAIGTGVGTLAGLAPIAVAGAAVPAGAIAGGVAAIPALLSLLFPRETESYFQTEATLPAGSNTGTIFGLGNRQLDAEQTLLAGRTGQTQFGRDYQSGPGLNLGFAARQALSFSPLVAAEGEAYISEFLGSPYPEINTRTWLPPRMLEGLADRQVREREERIAGARRGAVIRAQDNPFYEAVGLAYLGGVLPENARLSAAAATAFPEYGDQPTGFTAPAPVALPAIPPPAPTQPLTTPALPTTGVPTVPEISTSGGGGGFGGFLSGLGGVLEAATPLLQTILPRVLPMQQGPIFMPGGSIAPGGYQPGRTQNLIPAGYPQAQQAGFPLLGPGIGRALPYIGGALAENFLDVLPPLQQMLPEFLGGTPSMPAGNCIVPRMTQSMRLPSRVDVPNANGTFTTFKNMGRPILWTGDLAATKRVRKVASRARRAGGR